jgi:hypothetical protein
MRDAFYNGEVYEFRVVAFNLSGEAVSSDWPDAVPRRQVVPSGYNPRRFWNEKNGSNRTAQGWARARGIRCEPDHEQMICFGGPPNLTGQPMTVGDYFFFDGLRFRGRWYGANRADLEDLVVAQAIRRVEIRWAVGSPYWKYGPDLLRHEAVHSEQWNNHRLMQTFAYAYGYAATRSKDRTGSWACDNRFEKDANLYWGGYKVWNRQPSDPLPECP